MIRLLCVEDDPLMRAFLATRIAEEPDICVVGAVPDIERAKIYLQRDEIDVVLLDYQLQGRDGMHLVQAMAPWSRWDRGQEDYPAVLFCTGFGDAALCAQARLLGARGVVAKDRLASDLIPAIQTVAAGGFWFEHIVDTV